MSQDKKLFCNVGKDILRLAGCTLIREHAETFQCLSRDFLCFCLFVKMKEIRTRPNTAQKAYFIYCWSQKHVQRSAKVQVQNLGAMCQATHASQIYNKIQQIHLQVIPNDPYTTISTKYTYIPIKDLMPPTLGLFLDLRTLCFFCYTGF